MGGFGKLSSGSYELMAGKLELAAGAANGDVAVDGRELPALTRDQTLQLVEYWSDQSVRNLEPLPEWAYQAALVSLGYRKPGDRFQADRAFSSEFAHSMLPADALPLVWDGVAATAADLDAVPTPVRKPPRDFAMSTGVAQRWKRVAQRAWGRMKREREQQGVPPVPIPDIPPKLPPPFDDPGKWMPKNPFRGWGLVLLAIAGLYLTREN